jgi:succinate dehydrogenase/fumarate reductase flavoprotein subunit
LPVYACNALVLGSGAAGCRAAVELKRYGIDVVVATQNLYGGTSACSGSDKQTLHTAAAGRHGDDFIALRAALGAGGAMDEDTAYVEAVGSLRRCRRYNISDCRSRSTGWVQCSGIKRIMTKPGARRVADPAPLD